MCKQNEQLRPRMGQMYLALNINKHQNMNGIGINACTAKGDGILSPRKNTLYSNTVRKLVMIRSSLIRTLQTR
jgi:hypothetical protein